MTGQTPGKPPVKQRPKVVPSSRKTLFQSELHTLVSSVILDVGFYDLVFFDRLMFLTIHFQKLGDKEWTDSEICALVKYIALYHKPKGNGTDTWPVHKREDFWEICATAVMQFGGGYKRSCKYKLKFFLTVKYFHLFLDICNLHSNVKVLLLLLAE